MTAVLSPGPEHERFAEWSQEQGVVINGLAPARFAGRGLGIVAAKDLKEGDVLLKVPAKCLITIDSPAVRNLGLPRDCTVHGRLAAYLTLKNEDPARDHAIWQETWPSMEDFKQIMPFCWDKKLQDYLTPPAQALLENQEMKLRQDLEHLKDVIPAEAVESYKYFWLVVNTRCFYWDYPLTPDSRLPKRRADLKADDCLALCPFADYFNHTDEGCKVTSGKNGFTMTCHKDHKAGEEVYVSYGSHSNDFLLAEYGFMLQSNKWDSTTLDHLILPKATREQKDILQGDGFLGTYTLSTNSDYCHRTQSALRLIALPASRAKRRYDSFSSGADDGEVDQEIVDDALQELLQEYGDLCRKRMAGLRRMNESSQRDLLMTRWRETRELIDRHMNR